MLTSTVIALVLVLMLNLVGVSNLNVFVIVWLCSSMVIYLGARLRIRDSNMWRISLHTFDTSTISYGFFLILCVIASQLPVLISGQLRDLNTALSVVLAGLGMSVTMSFVNTMSIYALWDRGLDDLSRRASIMLSTFAAGTACVVALLVGIFLPFVLGLLFNIHSQQLSVSVADLLMLISSYAVWSVAIQKVNWKSKTRTGWILLLSVLVLILFASYSYLSWGGRFAFVYAIHSGTGLLLFLILFVHERLQRRAT
jgi:hypothetical protein